MKHQINNQGSNHILTTLLPPPTCGTPRPSFFLLRRSSRRRSICFTFSIFSFILTIRWQVCERLSALLFPFGFQAFCILVPSSLPFPSLFSISFLTLSHTSCFNLFLLFSFLIFLTSSFCTLACSLALFNLSFFCCFYWRTAHF
ncbi:hypothetical protein V8F33_011468 [Rhypophila sp. PSN 637]